MKKKSQNICRQASELVMQYRSLAVMSVYAVFYLIAFYYLEQRDVAVHEINLGIDEYVPFCEIFIVPYLLWFAYVALTVVFLCIKDKEESDRLVAFLMAGMTIFIVVSAVFPNGHNIHRPDQASVYGRHADQYTAEYPCVQLGRGHDRGVEEQVLCGPYGHKDSHARARCQHYLLDCADQAAFHAGCAAGAIAVCGDVFHLLQEDSDPGQTRICGAHKIADKNSFVPKLFFDIIYVSECRFLM